MAAPPARRFAVTRDVQFHNHPDYLNTRQKDAGRRYSSENAVYVGVRDREDKFCGFGIPDIVTLPRPP